MLTWVGVRGRGRQAVLEDLGLRPTGVRSSAPEAPVSGVALKGGWYIVVSNENDFDLDDARRMSGHGECVLCHVNERTKHAIAERYADGQKAWSAVHTAGSDEVKGKLPAGSKAVVAELRKKQAGIGDRDYLFDVPAEIARLATGFRHDAKAAGTPFEELAFGGGGPGPQVDAETLRKGRLLMYAGLGTLLGMTVVVMAVASSRGFVPQMVRLALTAVLCWLVYQGHVWAHRTLVVLLGLAVVLSLAMFAGTFGVRASTPWALVLAAVQAACLVMIVLPPAEGFLQVQRQRRMAGAAPP